MGEPARGSRWRRGGGPPTYEEVVQTVTIDIAAGQAVAEVGSDLGRQTLDWSPWVGLDEEDDSLAIYLVSGHIVQVGQVGVVEDNLDRSRRRNRRF